MRVQKKVEDNPHAPSTRGVSGLNVKTDRQKLVLYAQLGQDKDKMAWPSWSITPVKKMQGY